MKIARVERATPLILLALFAACSDPGAADADAAGPPDAAPDAYRAPATALFELPRGGQATSEFYALPFPNDLRRRVDGSFDLAGHVRTNALMEQYLDTLAAGGGEGGFGTNSAIFFRFDARIDPAALPATPEVSRDDPAAAVYLVDVDPDSPDRGRRVPLRLRFETRAGTAIGPDWLALLPYPGFPLRPRTTYAAVVARRLLATDGSPVARAPDFDALAGTGAGDADVVAARAVYQPLLAWLDEPGGDERDDVASAAVFTTLDATSLMARLRAVTWRDAPWPTASGVRFVERKPDYVLYAGTYDAPNYQAGAPPYNELGSGDIELDAMGDPVAQRTESIRFAVTIPTGEMPQAGWPIAIYGHGTGGDYRSFADDATAVRLAKQGLAALSFDAVLHGPRNAPGAAPETSFFNFQNPVAGRANVKQGAADGFQAVRLAMTLSITPRHPGARRAVFDPDRIYYFGHSQGGIVGPPFLAAEPLVKGAVLSGAGGLLYLTLLEKTEPIDVKALVENFIRDVPLDQFNNQLALLQWFIESSDPVNYGRLLVSEPDPAVGAKDIYQSEGFVDHYTPDPCIEALAVAIGGAPVEPVVHWVDGLGLRGLESVDAPVTANQGGFTSVFLQYDAGAGEGHFVVFDVAAARKQSAEFLGSLARDGRATLVEP
jgi:predicted esterase